MAALGGNVLPVSGSPQVEAGRPLAKDVKGGIPRGSQSPICWWVSVLGNGGQGEGGGSHLLRDRLSQEPCL